MKFFTLITPRALWKGPNLFKKMFLVIVLMSMKPSTSIVKFMALMVRGSGPRVELMAI